MTTSPARIIHTSRLLTPYLLVLTLALFLTACPQPKIIDERTMLAMTDGVQLDTRVIRPSGDGPWPTLLYRTPYDELSDATYRDWVSKGYAVVAQNCRGRYNSQGDDLAFASDGWNEHHDGLDTVNAILAQPWCNGRIGTFGASACGITQNLLAGANPSGICAQWIAKAPASLYDGVGFWGGAFRKEQVIGWIQGQDYGISSYAMFQLHPSYDEWWIGFDATLRQAFRNYPVIIETGWYDTFLQPAIDNFTTLQESAGETAREQSKLVITLSGHTSNQGAIPWSTTARRLPAEYSVEKFLECYVQQVDNGFNDLPRVAYYLPGDLTKTTGPGNLWIYADAWPPEADIAPLYFYNDHSMSLTKPPADASAMTYLYNPSSPVPTRGGANLVTPTGNFDQQSIESRSDVLLFNYGPLTEPVEITGQIEVTLYASSDKVDTDFTAKLTDVYPDGRSIILCDGIIRARYRDSATTPILMTPGQIYEFAINLGPMASVFDTGHTIRVAISSSNSPRFIPNPNTGANFVFGDPINPVTATNTIYVNQNHASHIHLPVVAVGGEVAGS